MLLLQTDQTYQVFICVLLLSAFGEVVCEYSWPLPNGFPIGSRAVIRGIPLTDYTPQEFYINFLPQTPFGDKGDIDFHIAARYGSGHIVLNNFILGKDWQQEIYKPDSRIKAGKPFEVTILSEPSHFSIYINDSHFYDFPHRKPLEKIKYLQVYGSTSVSLINVDLIAVHSWPLENGLPPSQKITIHGTPTKRNFDQQFSINLQDCSSYGKECDIAFRMLVQYRQKVFVNNSYQKGVGWGQPEVHSNSPIIIDQPFVISITNQSDQFKVYLNEQHFCTFKLQGPHSDVMYLVLKDAVDVDSITLSRNNFLLTEYKKVVNLSQVKNKTA